MSEIGNLRVERKTENGNGKQSETSSDVMQFSDVKMRILHF